MQGQVSKVCRSSELRSPLASQRDGTCRWLSWTAVQPEFVEVAEWLSAAGVTLFFAGSTYAVVRTSVVESWPRVTSKRISDDVRAVAQGHFDFSRLEPLMAVSDQEEGGRVAGREVRTALTKHHRTT